MKKIKKIAFGIVALIAMSMTFATDLSSPVNIPELQVDVNRDGFWNGYGTWKNITSGDEIVFQIHAYANGGDVQGLKARMDNLNQVIFESGTTISVNSQIKSDNTQPVSGAVQLVFNDKVKLVYLGYRWAKRYEDGNPRMEQYSTLPNEQNGANTLTANGVNLGNLIQDYRSNLLVRFKAEKAD